MLRSLWSSASGMIAQQTNLDVVAHNLANVNTQGYKKRRADFEDLLYQIGREPGTPIEPNSMVPTGVQVGLGTRVIATPSFMTQGNFQITENPLLGDRGQHNGGGERLFSGDADGRDDRLHPGGRVGRGRRRAGRQP